MKSIGYDDSLKNPKWVSAKLFTERSDTCVQRSTIELLKYQLTKIRQFIFGKYITLIGKLAPSDTHKSASKYELWIRKYLQTRPPMRVRFWCCFFFFHFSDNACIKYWTTNFTSKYLYSHITFEFEFTFTAVRLSFLIFVRIRKHHILVEFVR